MLSLYAEEIKLGAIFLVLAVAAVVGLWMHRRPSEEEDSVVSLTPDQARAIAERRRAVNAANGILSPAEKRAEIIRQRQERKAARNAAIRAARQKPPPAK